MFELNQTVFRHNHERDSALACPHQAIQIQTELSFDLVDFERQSEMLSLRKLLGKIPGASFDEQTQNYDAELSWLFTHTPVDVLRQSASQTLPRQIDHSHIGTLFAMARLRELQEP